MFSFIFKVLFIPLRILKYIYYILISPFRKGDHIFIEIPSQFSFSTKSFAIELLSGKESAPLFTEFLNDLYLISKTPGIKKISFLIDKLDFGLAELDEICRIVETYKSNGIKTSAYANSGDIKTIYFLSFMDKRYTFENGEFHCILPSVESFFFKKALKEWGVEVENYASGKSKSFAEMFTRESFSKEAKENISQLIESLKSQILERIYKNIGKEIQFFPVTNSKYLKENGFFDEFIDEEDFLNNLEYDDYKKPEEKEDKKSDYSEISIKSIQFIQRKKKFKLYPRKQDRITIIPLKGDIVEGSKEEKELKEGVIAAHSTISLLREIREDKKIKAVILEIDSGGGSAYASELIYREILRLRKEKKVYSYLNNIAASGGYYIACATEKIFSNPLCITGSVGTVMVRPDFKNFYNKLGITKDRIGFYPGREIFSEYGKLSKESKKFLQDEISRVKSMFYKIVSDNRKISEEELENYAGGRVFSGKDFLEYKMLDGNIGLFDTIEELKKDSELPNSIWEYLPPNYSFKSAAKNWRGLVTIVRDPLKALSKMMNKSELEFSSPIAKWIFMRF